MKKRPVLLFLITFSFIFLILSLWTYFKEKRIEEFSATLERFRSDFYEPSDKDALGDEIIAKKNRFFAYGTYVKIPTGEYVVTFALTSSSSEPASFQLQVASDKGKSVILSGDVRQEHFPVVKDLSFKVTSEREVEPRILYSSGNQHIKLEQVKIRKVKGIFPWLIILCTAILYAIGCILILLSIVSAFRNTAEWKYYLAGFLFFAGCFLILRRAWISEDAFITLRHVDHFIKGYGPVFNIAERVEGFTHPLWFGVLSLFRWIGLSPKGAAVLPGLMASIAALYFLFFKIRIKYQTGSISFLNPAAALLIGTSAFIDFGTSGLETSLSYLLLVLYAKFIIENRWQQQPILTGLIASLLTLTRPDFGLFMVLLFILYLYEIAKKNIPIKHLWKFLVFPILLVGGYQIFRMGYYAALLPNPFYAKSGAGAYWSQGLKYLWDFCRGSLFPVALFLVFLTLFLNRHSGYLKNRSLVLFSGLLHGFFVIRGGGDFMHGRFLLPTFLLITLSQSGAFDRLLNKKTALKIGGIAVCLIFFFSSLSVTPIQKRGQRIHLNITEERHFYYKDKIIPLKHLFTDTMILMWKTIGINYRDLARKAELNLRIAYKNVGFTGFYAGPRVYVLDELGLTDPVVSRITLKMRKRPGHEKNAPLGYLILRQLTFYDTPFPIWNKAAETKYGVLWDLSPRSLRKLHFLLDKDFKQQLDIRIADYLSRLEEAALPEDADFLFFLKQFWFPYAPKESQELFQLRYKQDTIGPFSESFRWIQTNRQKIDSHLSRLQEPLDAKRFLGNIGYALTAGLTLKFSPAGPAEE
jgi:arabinofuranosyltransferase